MPNSTEDSLRKKIVEILKNTSHITGVKEVKDWCSPIEHGVDIIFQRPDTFGVYRLYGIQVKVGNICPRTRIATKAIKEILGQVAIAFGHGFPINNSRQFLDGIYIVVDGQLNTFSEEYFLDARTGFRNVRIINGEVLEQFLQKGEASMNILRQT